MDKFLCVLGIFDEQTQQVLEEYQQAILSQGFAGRQTMGIPFHVTLGTFGLECREELEEKLRGLRQEQTKVRFTNIGMFQGQEVLFLAPAVNRELLTLKEAFGQEPAWAAHTTMLIDSKENVRRAAEILGDRFRQFSGTIAEAALYEFFPAKKLGERILEKGMKSK